MAEVTANPFLKELELWTYIHDWLRQSDGFEEQTAKVDLIIKSLINCVTINSPKPGVTQ